MDNLPLLLDSITDADATSAGRIGVSGSHGGIYAAAVASRAGLNAVLLNDAGIGLEDAGVAGVLALADVGMAAAALDCMSCRIGSAEDGLARGRVSVANAVATALGVTPGMTCNDAVERLAHAPAPAGQLPPVEEARRTVTLDPNGVHVHLADSASLVRAEDAGAIVVTGSHGGLIGGNPNRAMKADARIGVFNNAGVGADGVGITRLPALEGRGVAAVTVDAGTARIGDAASALETGVISHVNGLADDLGARPGLPLTAWLGGL